MMNQAEIEANVTLEQALRRANLLAAAAQVSQHTSQIMDTDELLPKTVDIICDAYNFYYAGIFLINGAGDFAVLRAGRGEPGRIMIENNHKLAVGGNSMIGACTAQNEARISLDVDAEKVWYPNPVLPKTRSEMALPLAVGSKVIGAVTVQSTEAAAFSDEDVSSLQAMANQLAIAIENARQRHELEETHAELLRAKTFEAIATATGDAIHWIGNKAEPIRGTVDRIRNDLKTTICMMANLFEQHQLPDTAFIQLVKQEAAAIRETDPDSGKTAERLSSLSAENLKQQLSFGSMLDDLQIIEDANTVILKIKEELIGPAREQAPRPTMLDDVIKDTLTGLALPLGLLTVKIEGDLPLALADPIQLHRVFTNVIKNAQEAASHRPDPHISVTVRPDEYEKVVIVEISDNGPGISPDIFDKIWITFHTTKGIKEHSGLGLPASRLILDQIGGSISAENEPGHGATFTMRIPTANGSTDNLGKAKSRKGKIMVIDDNDSWRHFATGSLKAAGFKVDVREPHSGLADANKYDLVIIDDILAANDSLDIMTALKRGGAIGKTVAVSSNPRVERTKTRLLMGLKNLIPKPYTQGSLLNAVDSALNL